MIPHLTKRVGRSLNEVAIHSVQAKEVSGTARVENAKLALHGEEQLAKVMHHMLHQICPYIGQLDNSVWTDPSMVLLWLS